MTAWADGLLRASIQGGLTILGLALLFRLFPRIPGSVQAWMWRAVALKFLVGMVFPITIFTQTWQAAGYLRNDPLPNYIFMLSVIGLTLALAAVTRDWFLIRTHLKKGVPVELEALDRITQTLRLNKRPVVLLRQNLDRPMLSGLLKSTIHLPADLDEETQKMVLAHECAHIKRRDLAWEWLFVMVEALFFFHPLVWLMRREHRMAQENACDALAISAANAKVVDYGRMLLNLTIVDKRTELAMTANMASTYAALRTRILRLHRGAAALGPVSAVLLLMIAVAILPTWRTEFKLEIPIEQPQPAPAASPLSRFGDAPVAAFSRAPKEGRP